MANELFHQADINKDGKLQLSELRSMLNNASKQYSHFAEHARFLDGCARNQLSSFSHYGKGGGGGGGEEQAQFVICMHAS